jgi:hypothetical protein
VDDKQEIVNPGLVLFQTCLQELGSIFIERISKTAEQDALMQEQVLDLTLKFQEISALVSGLNEKVKIATCERVDVISKRDDMICRLRGT